MYQNPTISGLRVPQIATGAFLKLNCILNLLNFEPRDIICGGDGSGGMSACLLRKYKTSRLIFNSLLLLSDSPMGGTLPTPPSALASMSSDIYNRCVNFNKTWTMSSDLSSEKTWSDFGELISSEKLHVDLIVLDMELTTDATMQQIETNLRNRGIRWLPGRESNPGLLRDRRGYLSLYYTIMAKEI